MVISPSVVKGYSPIPSVSISQLQSWWISTLLLVMLIASSANAQAPLVDVTSSVSVTTSQETTRYDRRTRQLIKTALVTIQNTSSDALGTPLHAVFDITNTRVSMPGAAGGFGQPPYNTFYFDVSGSVPGGSLGQGEQLSFTATFTSGRRDRFNYSVRVFAPESQPDNVPPTANAGPDAEFNLSIGQETFDIVLDGSGSSDTDGTVDVYAWSGSPDPDDVVNPSVTLGAGSYTFTLIVTDDDGAASAPDSVNIVINPAPNQPPTADAGPDQTINLTEGQQSADVQLDGSGSSDPDGTVTGFQWGGTPDPDDVVGPAVNLAPGVYEFSLVVVDNDGASSAPDTVTVTVNAFVPNNIPPSANAGPDRELTIFGGEDTVAVQLNGSLSIDTDGTIVSYNWGGSPDPEDVAQPSVRLPEGVHVFSLTVTDNLGAASALDQVQITVSPLGQQNSPVVTIEGQAFTLNEGETLSFNVSATDPDGDAVSLTGAPAISNAVFTSTNGVNAAGTFEFNPDFTQAGTYPVVFTAIDPFGLSSTATAVVTVQNVNRAPSLIVESIASVDEGKLLTVVVGTQDDDGDQVEVSAANVPENAVFIPGSKSLVFAPDFEQQGDYVVTFEGTDGQAAASPVDLNIEVIDVPAGQAGGPSELVLNVDPLESPTFQPSTRITGSVNASSNPPAVPKVISALVTSLFPATGRQGESLSVEISGDSAGSFPPNFVPDESNVNFGPGVTVDSVTVNDANSITAEITVSPDAALGVRGVTVQTGAEVAVSVVAFNVRPGTTTISGVLIDPDSGSPISGALISVVGTNAATTTAADGSFTLTGAPAGLQKVIVNPPNFQSVVIDVSVQANAVVDLGQVESFALVFDPSGPPSASLPSVMGRGLSSTEGNIGLDEAKQLVIDTYLAVGGTEAGVLDEFGNQLNPNVEGAGLISLEPAAVEKTAEAMIRGDGITLQEVLFGLAFFTKWEKGSPPTALQMIKGLQDAVDAAWLDQRAESSAIVLAIFNAGRSISPEPPTLNFSTKLSAPQSQLLVLSFLGYNTLIREANPGLYAALDRGETKSLFARLGDIVIPPAYAQALDDVVPPGSTDRFTTYWSTVIEQWDNLPRGEYNDDPNENEQVVRRSVSTIQVMRASTWVFGTDPNPLGQSGAPTVIQGTVEGTFGQPAATIPSWDFSQSDGIFVPPNAQPEEVRQIVANTITVQTANGPADVVSVEFRRSDSDEPGVAANRTGRFIYRLWRWNGADQTLDYIGAGEPEAQNRGLLLQGGTAVAIDPQDPNRFSLLDPSPPQGTVGYRVDVIRTYDMNISPSGFDSVIGGIGWWRGVGEWGSVVDNEYGGLAYYPAQVVSGVTYNISPLSDAVVTFVGPRPSGADPADSVQYAPDRFRIYESIPPDNAIYEVNAASLERSLFVRPNFTAPFQQGLAVDAAGNLYTENAAGNARFGGKIFRFEGPESGNTGARSHVGMANYYSFALGFARPTSVLGMAIAPDGQLFIADGVENRIEKVPVNETYDAFSRVGQPFATSDLFRFNPGMDMFTTPDNTLFLVQSAIKNIVQVDGISGQASKLFSDADGDRLFSSPRSITFDRFRTAYISDEGASPGAGTGVVYAIPSWFQDPDGSLDECLVKRFTLLDGLANVSFVRVGPFDQSLVYRENAETKRLFLGLTGQVFNTNAAPIPGLEVSVTKEGSNVSETLRTDECGVFKVFGLSQNRGSSRAQVEIKDPNLGTRKFEITMPGVGHLWRDFTIYPEPPLPQPVDDEPSDPPADPPPPPAPDPAPVPVTVVPGEITYLPPIVVEVTEVDAPDPRPGDPPPIPPPPPQQPVVDPGIPIQITAPIDGQTLTGTLDDEVVKLLEIRFGSELSEVNALLTDPTSGLTAEAYANGQRIVFSSDTFTGVSDDQSIVSHEVAHTLQTDTSLTDPETGALSAEQISRVQDQLGISVVVKDENGVVRGADSITVRANIELQEQLDGTFRKKILPPGRGSLVGRIVDLNGDPVSQAELKSLSAQGATNSTVFTNRTGSFILAEEPISTVQVDPSTPTRVRVGVGQ